MDNYDMFNDDFDMDQYIHFPSKSVFFILAGLTESVLVDL